MTRPWSKPEVGEIAIWDHRGAAIPVSVRGYSGSAVEALKRLVESPGIALMHNSQWPPVAIIG